MCAPSRRQCLWLAPGDFITGITQTFDRLSKAFVAKIVKGLNSGPQLLHKRINKLLLLLFF